MGQTPGLTVITSSAVPVNQANPGPGDAPGADTLGPIGSGDLGCAYPSNGAQWHNAENADQTRPIGLMNGSDGCLGFC
jgi:hypothetical protein